MNATDTPKSASAARSHRSTPPPIGAATPSTILSSCNRLLVLIFAGSLILPVLAYFAAPNVDAAPLSFASTALKIVGCLAAIVILTFGFRRLLQKLQPYLAEQSLAQSAFLESLSSRFVPVAIAGSAAVSLLLELAVIRWQGTIFEFFAFYKNYGLLACFAGLGLGYALSRSNDGIPLLLSVPLIGSQFILLLALRFGLPERIFTLSGIPFREQLNMGFTAQPQQLGSIYLLLSVVFLLTALAFLPIGQLCGKLMERTSQLPAYGLNLLGSLAGVAGMFLVSLFWTPPLIWFGLCFLAVLLFTPRIPKTQLVAATAAVISLLALAWPVNPLWNKIYSPYQLLEVGYQRNGLMIIHAAGHYYQRVHNLSDAAVSGPGNDDLRAIRDYYNLPYQFHPGANRVAIVGAGSGNDVAAALRSGAAHVDAIEIDPAILMTGKAYHPEHPYEDSRVRPIVNDARSFFRTTPDHFDLIVYGLLDSHTLLSANSSVRLDSFVYTIEGLREARARLTSNGVLSLSFSVMSPDLGTKIFRMMTEAFGGHEPLCFRTNYDRSVIFLQNKNGDLVAPPSVLSSGAVVEAASQFRNPSAHVDVSTDDWPFLYMPRRVYPVSYLIVLGLILLLSFLLYGSFFREAPEISHLPFFFLGAGFMLVETKAITEMGLAFGNTWHVIALAIAGILVMAFLANLLAQRVRLGFPLLGYILLFAALGFGWWISKAGGLPSTPSGRLGTLLVLTCPLFFSGLIFSALLAKEHRISSVMSMNLMGTMLGGILEYNSMYFGFRFLYILALGLYAAALLTSWLPKRETLAPSA